MSPNRCRVWNLYGSPEMTIGCTMQLVDSDSQLNSIPIGSLIRWLSMHDFG